MINGPFSALSGGWRSRCSLATSLLVKSDVLLLDEVRGFSCFRPLPMLICVLSQVTNFLDLEATIWLEGFLSAESDRTVVAISHDQQFLSNVVEETIVLRNQKLVYFEGTPAQMELEEKKEGRRLLGAKEALDKKREHVSVDVKSLSFSADQTCLRTDREVDSAGERAPWPRRRGRGFSYILKSMLISTSLFQFLTGHRFRQGYGRREPTADGQVSPEEAR